MRRRRRQLDLTQEELAKQVACSPNTIRKLETDERRPSKPLAERLAHFLVIPAHEQARFVAFARAQGAEEQAGAGMAAPPAQMARVDWGEAPDVTTFYGRQVERG